MKQRVARIISLYRNHNNCFRPNPCLISSSSPLSTQKIRLFASKSENKEEPINEAVDNIDQELKKGIERFMKGDGEAIPSIFEAILKRKLAGKSDESAYELMKELNLPPLDDDVDVDDVSDIESDSYDGESEIIEEKQAK